MHFRFLANYKQQVTKRLERKQPSEDKKAIEREIKKQIDTIQKETIVIARLYKAKNAASLPTSPENLTLLDNSLGQAHSAMFKAETSMRWLSDQSLSEYEKRFIKDVHETAQKNINGLEKLADKMVKEIEKSKPRPHR